MHTFKFVDIAYEACNEFQNLIDRGYLCYISMKIEVAILVRSTTKKFFEKMIITFSVNPATHKPKGEIQL